MTNFDFIWQNIIHVIAAGNALLLCFALVINKKFKRSRAHWFFTGYLFSLASLLWIFTSINAYWINYSQEIQLFEYFLITLVPALFLSYVLSILSISFHLTLVFIPSILFLLIALFIDTSILLKIKLEHLIFMQIIYTTITSFIIISCHKVVVKWPSHIIFLIISVWLLHISQVLRIILNHSDLIFDLVPFIGALFFLTLTWIIFNDPKAIRKLTQTLNKIQLDNDEYTSLLVFMKTNKPHLDPHITLNNLALLMSTSTRELSALINQRNENYYQFINKFRISEAQDILWNENEKRTSVEAIAMMVGFKSRSSFYQAFREVNNMSPIEYKNLK